VVLRLAEKRWVFVNKARIKGLPWLKKKWSKQKNSTNQQNVSQKNIKRLYTTPTPYPILFITYLIRLPATSFAFLEKINKKAFSGTDK
jgi:hypothetical protein